jgi:phosphatidate cytidylyltransferase
MLKQRIVTALILIPIFLFILFFLPPSWFCLLTGLIVVAAAWEWAGLMGLKTAVTKSLYLLIILFLLSWLLFVPINMVGSFLIGTFVFWLFSFVLVCAYPRGSAWWGNSIFVRGLMGIFTLLPCWMAINVLRNEQTGIYLILLLFVLIWGADSAAYFVGKKWGKTKLAPLVSPGKSLQGLIGALIASVFITVIFLVWLRISWEFWPWLIGLSMITVLFSVLGDLFESMMKRQSGVKDSGRLLPGHGGLLDRIDSLTAAAPIFALGGMLLSTILS